MRTSNKAILSGAGALFVLGVITACGPASQDAVALTDSRHKFSDYCENSIRSQLSMPATYEPNHIFAGPPKLVQWPDQTASWTWTVPFKAANAYGAIGQYQAVCTQDLEGKVVARIGPEQ